MYSNILEILICIFFVIGLASWLSLFHEQLQKLLEKAYQSIQYSNFQIVENTKKLLENSQKSEREKAERIFALERCIQQMEQTYSEELKANRTAYEVRSQESTSSFQQAKPQYQECTSKQTRQPADIIKVLFNGMLKDYQVGEENIFDRAISDFQYVREKREVRCALPYLVILKVLNMYEYQDMKHFIAAFDYFFQYSKSVKSHRILRNKFLTPAEKLSFINKEIDIIALDSHFSEFLLFMLESYDYKEFRLLHRNFHACFNVRYDTGIVEVFVATQEAKALFESRWKKKTYYTIHVIVEKSMVGGIIIKDGDISVDYSYQELAIKYIENVNEELHYG